MVLMIGSMVGVCLIQKIMIKYYERLCESKYRAEHKSAY